MWRTCLSSQFVLNPPPLVDRNKIYILILNLYGRIYTQRKRFR